MRKYYKIEAIILFGSYAKGTENEDSDIDIAIISSDFNDIIEDGAKLIGLTWKIDTRIELHPITVEDYRKVSNPFVKEVVDTGIKVA
ncbi:MAG: nucleotidyltransferase domain-containing protein [Clostridia bacterium]